MTVIEAIQAAERAESAGIPVDWKSMCMQVYNGMQTLVNEQGAKIKALEDADAEGQAQPSESV